MAKDLQQCVQLLSQMLDKDTGTINSNGGVKANRVGSRAFVTTGRINRREPMSKSAAIKGKCSRPAKVLTSGKKKPKRVGSLSVERNLVNNCETEKSTTSTTHKDVKRVQNSAVIGTEKSSPHIIQRKILIGEDTNHKYGNQVVTDTLSQVSESDDGRLLKHYPALFNHRLASSTPADTPRKLRDIKGVLILNGSTDTQVLNSTDEIRSRMPLVAKPPEPHLVRAKVDFAPNPRMLEQYGLTVSTPMDAVIQNKDFSLYTQSDGSSSAVQSLMPKSGLSAVNSTASEVRKVVPNHEETPQSSSDWNSCRINFSSRPNSDMISDIQNTAHPRIIENVNKQRFSDKELLLQQQQTLSSNRFVQRNGGSGDGPNVYASQTGGNTRQSSSRDFDQCQLVGMLEGLKDLISDKHNVEVGQLIQEIQELTRTMSKGTNVLPSFNTELDLALQPLRSENAQLRRRVRILNQQVTDKEKLLEVMQKPDASFQVVHLTMLNQHLEKLMQETRIENENLLQKNDILQIEIDRIKKDKAEMLQVIAKKDNDHMKSLHEKTREILQASAIKMQSERKNAELNDDLQKLVILVKQKDDELDHLRELVRSLQQSMSRLVHDLQCSRPNSQLANTLSLVRQQLDSSTSKLDSAPVSARTSASARMVPSSRQESDSTLTPSGVRRSLNFETKTSRLRSTNDHETNTSDSRSHRSDANQTRSRHEDEILNGPRDERRTGSVFHRLDQVQTGSSSAVKVQEWQSGSATYNGFADVTSNSLDTTHYLAPPVPDSAYQNLKTREPVEEIQREAQEKHVDGLTVKELLTPITDRMKYESHKCAMFADQKKLQSEKDHWSKSSCSSDLDSTLTIDEDQMDQIVELQPSYSDASRHSLKDYFRKYPTALKGDRQPNALDGGNVEINGAAFLKEDSPDEDEPSMSIQLSDYSESTSDLRHSSEAEEDFLGPNAKDLREELRLDLSSIRIHSDVDSVETLSTASTIGSASSADDRAFKEGLANLDANIAKIQEQLRKDLTAKYPLLS